MRKTLALLLLCIELATSDLSPYKPRGWRPNGQHFNPTNNRLQTYYGPPRLPAYGPPETTTTFPIFTTATAPTSTTTTTTRRTTTTPRSREPTTPPNVPQEEFDVQPALAVANSFAFNRPVYIYNSFPFLPGQILAK